MFLYVWTFIVAFLISSLVIFTYKIIEKHRFFKIHEIPHEPPVPIFGNILPVLLRRINVSDLIQKLYNTYPNAKYIGLYDFMNAGIVLRDLELIKFVGVKNFDSFTDHGMFGEEPRDSLFGRNLFLLKGEKWHNVRSLLSPAFTSSKMKTLYKLISESAINFAEFLENDTEGNKMREMKEAFTRYTNDVIVNCALGISVNTMKDPNNEFYLMGKEATNMEKLTIKVFLMREFPFLMNFFNIKLVDPRIHRFFNEIVKSTIKIRDAKRITRPDMLQLMMNARGKGDETDLTPEERTAQAFVFFFGGFDATSTAMSCAAHELAINPEIQKKLQEEIDSVLRVSNGDPCYDAINGMEYLDAITSETLRKYPILPVLDRVCTKSFEFPPTEPGAKPFIVKPGMTVWIPVVGFHYDANYYQEPQKFNPDRFLKNGSVTNKSATFLSFGIGPRHCIGSRFALLKTKTMLFHLLARCNLKVCPKTSVPLKQSKKTLGFAVDDGYWMQLEKREKNFV